MTSKYPINLSTIPSTRLMEAISQEKYEELRNLANTDYKSLTSRNFNLAYGAYGANANRIPADRLNYAKGKCKSRASLAKYNIVEKNIYISSVVFGSDETFCEKLLSSGVTLEQLVLLSKGFANLSTIEKSKNSLDEQDNSILSEVELLKNKRENIKLFLSRKSIEGTVYPILDKVMDTIIMYYAVASTTLVMTKINELLVFQRQLLETMLPSVSIGESISTGKTAK